MYVSPTILLTVSFLQIMYRPLKDLNGIHGANSLVMCLTGYQRQDREDIMVCDSIPMFHVWLFTGLRLLFVWCEHSCFYGCTGHSQTLVRLMGSQFSKPLVANKVTHLICYKFEGMFFKIYIIKENWQNYWTCICIHL